MKKTGYTYFAEIIFITHFFLVLLVLSGFLIEEIWGLYFTALILTLISDLFFGYCILSKWEYDLRKKDNPDLEYPFTWSTFYTYKFTKIHIRDAFFNRIAQIFLVASIVINVVTKYML